MARPYELLLFGGSQQGIADSARSRLSTMPADALWHCSLLEGEWRTVPAAGAVPGARSGHSAVMYDGKMWMYGGWNDSKGEPFGDMHTLHIGEGAMRWEEVTQRGYPMEARAWHSVCVHDGRMLLYGDNGECSQSQAQHACVYAFDFARCSWSQIPCKGRHHPQPQFVLAVTVHEGAMYALCFTEPSGRARGAAQRGAPGEEPDEGELLVGAADALPGAGDAAAEESFMEVYRLDLHSHTWSKVACKGDVPAGRYGCSASKDSDGLWLVHGGISKSQGFCILGETFSFDFATAAWARLHSEEDEACIPRTGHVAVPIGDATILVGGNSCVPTPLAQPRALHDPRRAPGSLLSHGLHFSTGSPVGGTLASHLPAIFRNEDNIAYCTVAEVLWRRPREPAGAADASICNVDVIQGLRELLLDAASAAAPCGGAADGGLADLTVVTSDGHRLPAFRALLAASAQPFRAMFSHGMQESATGVVELDATREEAALLLEYVHGTMTRLAPETARPLFQLADRYGLRALSAACINSLTQHLTADSLPSLLELSDMHSCTALMDACVEFVQMHRERLPAIIGSDAFIKLMSERPVKAQQFLLACMSHSQLQLAS